MNESKQPMIFNKLNQKNIEAYTPKYAVDIIIPYLRDKERERNKEGFEFIIWAPFSKEQHNFVNYLRNLGFKVVNTHYDPETKEGEDFLTYEPNFHFDMILDNPPFKGKYKFIERAFKFGKPFALFLPLNSMGDIGTPELFLKNNAEPQMLIPKQRTEFHNQKENGISFKTIYLCKDVLPKQIIIKEMNKRKLLTGNE